MKAEGDTTLLVKYKTILNRYGLRDLGSDSCSLFDGETIVTGEGVATEIIVIWTLGDCRSLHDCHAILLSHAI